MAEAVTSAQHAFDLCTEALGATHPATLVAALQLADALGAFARPDEAIAIVSDAMAIEERTTADARWRVRASSTLARALYNAGRYEESLSAIADGRRIGATIPADGNFRDEDLLRIELMVLLQLRRNQDAYRVASALVDGLIADRGERHAFTLQAQIALAAIEVELDHLDAGEARFRELGEHLDASPARRIEVERGLAKVALKRGHYDEAKRGFTSVVDYFVKAGQPGYAGDTRASLAHAMLAKGERKEGIAELRRARAELAEAGKAWWQEVKTLESVAAAFDVEL